MDTAVFASALLFSLLIYLLVLSVYRVYFSPVSHIPGPLLAKVTFWYEFYWDVVQIGRYTFHIQELHQRYGPIIRVNPYEVHINDPDFYDEVYVGAASGRKRNKWAWLVDSFGIPDSTFSTVDHDVHRTRRAALNPFFSKTKVRALQGRIEDVFGRLLARLTEFKEKGEPMSLGLAFTAVSNDIASSYAFDKQDFRVDAPDFAPNFHHASEKAAKQSHLMKQFPWLLRLSQKMPDHWITSMDPDLGAYISLQRDLQQQTKEIETAYNSPDYKARESTTIFHEILASSHLPEYERKHSRLWQDGQTILVAGTITTATTMSNMIFFLLTQPETLKQVRDELSAVVQDKNSPLSLPVLEGLPFLTAFIMEALRYSNGVCTRLQRIDPDKPVVFHARKDSIYASASKDATYVLPAGTPISMTAMLIHLNPLVYQDPKAFEPSRWLDVDSTTNRSILHHKLDKYFLPFTKGTRACLGINLAWAELYLLTAMMFRPGAYGSKDDQRAGDAGYLELFETSFENDIEIVGDGTTPIVRQPMVGVRVKIHPCEAKES